MIACSLDQNLHTGANMEYQSLPPVDVAMASTADVVVAELNEALGSGSKNPWKVKVPAKAKAANGAAISMEQVATALRDQFNDPENVTFCTLGRGWPFDLWPFQNGMAYLGKDGGGGLGSGPGLSVGSALALHDQGRYAISMLGDGDFCMGATAIWSAAHHRIPLAGAGEQQPLLFQRRAAPGKRGAHPWPRGEEPLDRIAAGRSDARISRSSPRRRAR